MALMKSITSFNQRQLSGSLARTRRNEVERDINRDVGESYRRGRNQVNNSPTRINYVLAASRTN